MTTQTSSKRPVRATTVAIAITGALLAGAACLVGLVFSPVIATPVAAVLALAAVVIATRKTADRGPMRSALVGIAAGIALVLAFYWTSALIHME